MSALSEQTPRRPTVEDLVWTPAHWVPVCVAAPWAVAAGLRTWGLLEATRASYRQRGHVTSKQITGLTARSRRLHVTKKGDSVLRHRKAECHGRLAQACHPTTREKNE